MLGGGLQAGVAPLSTTSISESGGAVLGVPRAPVESVGGVGGLGGTVVSADEGSHGKTLGKLPPGEPHELSQGRGSVQTVMGNSEVPKVVSSPADATPITPSAVGAAASVIGLSLIVFLLHKVSIILYT